ncbi:MAG: hypothetical protein RLZZ598_857, partial [Pseudomonadota bacterium]
NFPKKPLDALAARLGISLQLLVRTLARYWYYFGSA